MIPEKLTEVLKHDGVVAIATMGQDGPHMVNTWNSYVRITNDERILIPVGYMHRTEANIAFNGSPRILMEKKFHFTAPSDFHIQFPTVKEDPYSIAFEASKPSSSCFY